MPSDSAQILAPMPLTPISSRAVSALCARLPSLSMAPARLVSAARVLLSIRAAFSSLDSGLRESFGLSSRAVMKPPASSTRLTSLRAAIVFTADSGTSARTVP